MIEDEVLSAAARRHPEPVALTDCDETLGSATQPRKVLDVTEQGEDSFWTRGLTINLGDELHFDGRKGVLQRQFGRTWASSVVAVSNQDRQSRTNPFRHDDVNLVVASFVRRIDLADGRGVSCCGSGRVRARAQAPMEQIHRSRKGPQ